MEKDLDTRQTESWSAFPTGIQQGRNSHQFLNKESWYGSLWLVIRLRLKFQVPTHNHDGIFYNFKV